MISFHIDFFLIVRLVTDRPGRVRIVLTENIVLFLDLILIMISSRFTHLGFLHLTVLFLCFSCYFSENYNSSQGQGELVKLLTDPHNEEIVFRIINGNPAKLGDIPYQVRNTRFFCIIMVGITKYFVRLVCPRQERISLRKFLQLFSVSGIVFDTITHKNVEFDSLFRDQT